ncbi:MAG TPA: MFS transporter [Thermomicrobiales bacterium]|jgi:MFS family permease
MSDGERVHLQTASPEAQPSVDLGGASLAVAQAGTRLPVATPAKRAVAKQPSLLRDEAFFLFWLSRLLTQTGQGALVYALLIIVVDRTDASFFNSLFVVSAILPALAFGLPAGIVVDSIPRRPLMICLNLARFSFALALVAREPSLPGIFAASLGIWTIQQFYAPAESSLLPTLVPRGRLTGAQALSNLALTLAQALGLVLLAPLMLKTTGPTSLFAVCAVLFVAATVLVALLPTVEDHLTALPVRQPARRLREALALGWRTVRNDHVVYEVLTDDVLVGVGGSALVVITPLYLKGVLNTAAENTVFVFAPAALGLVVGLRVSGWIGLMLGPRRVATWGLMLFALCIGSLGFVSSIHTFLVNGLGIPVDRIAATLHVPPLILIVMVISIPAGFASSVVSVSARSVLLARTPPASRGQVIATQSLIQNVGALIPTLVAGIAADLIGVERVAVAIAALMAAGAVAALTKYRPVPAPATTG